MLRAIAFGLAFGAGFQAWRNYPPDGPVSGDMALVVLLVGVVCAYLGGKARRGHGAVAVATATAEATAVAGAHSRVNVINVVAGGGPRPVGLSLPSEDAPWTTGEQLPQLTVDQLDGMDLAELLEETSTEVDS